LEYSADVLSFSNVARIIWMRSAVEAPDEPYIILIDLSALEILFFTTRNTGLSGMKAPTRMAKPAKAH
jgi:hypothetical protein